MPKKGWRMDVNAKRVPLWGHGPKVDPATKKEMEMWRDFYGVPFGRAIDAMLMHARSHAGFRIPTKGRKTYRQVPRKQTHESDTSGRKPLP
jgi:hypothetical protein